MGLAYENLDVHVRRYMLEEIELDVANSSIYLSNYLNSHGTALWPDLLRQAAQNGSDDSLSDALVQHGCLKTQVERRKPSGGYTMARVPVTAAVTMGEGEFNRYYVRGLCRFAIDNGLPYLQVYRAKAVAEPRPASEAKLGTHVDPRTILDDLRTTIGVEPALGLPPGPNSGLTLRLL